MLRFNEWQETIVLLFFDAIVVMATRPLIGGILLGRFIQSWRCCTHVLIFLRSIQVLLVIWRNFLSCSCLGLAILLYNLFAALLFEAFARCLILPPEGIRFPPKETKGFSWRAESTPYFTLPAFAGTCFLCKLYFEWTALFSWLQESL